MGRFGKRIKVGVAGDAKVVALAPTRAPASADAARRGDTKGAAEALGLTLKEDDQP